MFHVKQSTFSTDVDKIRQGLYIHIPFCKSKCSYCDFYRIVDLSYLESYVDSVIKEMYLTKNSINHLSTIYLGGGTPSVLGPFLLNKLLSSISKYFKVSCVEEFTVECNPEDITEDLVDVLINNGVNRVSLGVQSLNEKMLKFLNRRHDSNKVYDSISLLHSKNINNISVDLIFGYPSIDNYVFKDDVDSFINLDIKHLSAYSLSYEEGAWITRLVNQGKIKPLDDDLVADQYNYLIHKLKDKGFNHYEISNYCKDNYYSHHNVDCWNRNEYLGLGPGASSFINNKRFTNICNVKKYIDNINENIIDHDEDILCDNDVYNEIVMLGLRTAKGVNINDIPNSHKEYFLNNTKVLIDDGYLEICGDNYIIPEEKWFVLDMITEKCMI